MTHHFPLISYTATHAYLLLQGLSQAQNSAFSCGLVLSGGISRYIIMIIWSGANGGCGCQYLTMHSWSKVLFNPSPHCRASACFFYNHKPETIFLAWEVNRSITYPIFGDNLCGLMITVGCTTCRFRSAWLSPRKCSRGPITRICAGPTGCCMQSELLSCQCGGGVMPSPDTGVGVTQGEALPTPHFNTQNRSTYVHTHHGILRIRLGHIFHKFHVWPVSASSLPQLFSDHCIHYQLRHFLLQKHPQTLVWRKCRGRLKVRIHKS